MANLLVFISEWQCLSKDALVEKLVEKKDTEELTSLKLEQIFIFEGNPKAEVILAALKNVLLMMSIS